MLNDIQALQQAGHCAQCAQCAVHYGCFIFIQLVLCLSRIKVLNLKKNYSVLCLTSHSFIELVSWYKDASGFGDGVEQWYRSTPLHIVALVVQLLRSPSRSLWPSTYLIFVT